MQTRVLTGMGAIRWGDTGEVSVNRVHEFVKISRVHRNKKG